MSFPWKYTFDFGHECCWQLSPFINRYPLSATKEDLNQTWGEPECVFTKMQPLISLMHQINPMHNWEWTYEEYIFFSHPHSRAQQASERGWKRRHLFCSVATETSLVAENLILPHMTVGFPARPGWPQLSHRRGWDLLWFIAPESRQQLTFILSLYMLSASRGDVRLPAWWWHRSLATALL